MSATRAPNASREADVGRVDMQLEIDIIPVSMSTAPSSSMDGWVGGSTTTSLRWTAFGSSNSRRRAPAVRSRSVRGSLWPRLARPRGGWLSPTSKRLMVNSSGATSTRVTCGTARRSQSRRGSPAPTRARELRVVLLFSDPDGNTWLVQEVTTRLPGRIDAAGTAFGLTADLASALRRTEAAHAEHEKRAGERDEDWPTWYASYIGAEQAGTDLPT